MSKWCLSITRCAVVLLVGAGCTDLSAIRQFAEVLSESARYTALVEEYTNTFNRRESYEVDDQVKKVLQAESRTRRMQREGLVALHTVIAEYMQAMGRLAADKVVSLDEDLDKLGGELKKLDALKDKDAAVDAYVGLTKILFDALADGWRQRQLKSLIESANSHFQVVAGSLKNIADKDFRRSLTNERRSVVRFFDDILDRAKGEGAEAVRRLARTLQSDHTAVFDRKEKALDEYVMLIEKIAAGQQRLYDRRVNLGSEDLLKHIHQRAVELAKAYRNVRDLER